MATRLYLDTPQALAAACSRWAEAPVLALDTEFVRTRTFYPRLGLIQIAVESPTAADTTVALLDPLTLTDLEPLAQRLRDPRQLKVLHSSSEDLEVLFHRLGELPAPLFDTQIAAALAGHGYSQSYASLVSRLLAIDLPKAETRTDWLQRPLTEAQLSYAALDVAYLPELHAQLSAQLAAIERTSWAEEEFRRLGDAERFSTAPETAYKRLKPAPGMSRRQIAVLRELCGWREIEARQRDLPRNFVVQEEALRQIARQLPKSPEALAKVRALEPQELRRHGSALLAAVATALALPEDELPAAPARPLDLTPHRALLTQLRNRVAARAAELGLPAELLATRRSLEQLLRHALEGGEPTPPPELEGWRWGLVVPVLRGLLPSLPPGSPGV